MYYVKCAELRVKLSEDIISGNSQIYRQLIKYAYAGAGNIDYLYIATDSNDAAQRAKEYYNFTKEDLREQPTVEKSVFKK